MTILRRHSGTIALACAVLLTFAIASGIVYAIEWYTDLR